MSSIITTGLGRSSHNTFTAPVFEGYSFEDGGSQTIIIESYDDSLQVMEALSGVDILILEGASDEVVVEASVSGVIERIKKALKTLWGKIKAFFESIIRFFDSLTKSGADFAKKYGEQIRKKDLSGFKHKLFKYSIPESPEKNANDANKQLENIGDVINRHVGTATGGAEEGKRILEDLKQSTEEEREKIRGYLVGRSVNADEFRKALFGLFRSNAESKDDKEEMDISHSDIASFVEVVKGTEKLKKAINSAKTFTDKSFNTYLKNLDAAEKKVKMVAADPKDGEVKGSASIFSGLCQHYYKEIQFMQSVTLQYYNAWIDAVKERDRSYRAVMQSALSYKPKK